MQSTADTWKCKANAQQVKIHTAKHSETSVAKQKESLFNKELGSKKLTLLQQGTKFPHSHKNRQTETRRAKEGQVVGDPSKFANRKSVQGVVLKSLAMIRYGEQCGSECVDGRSLYNEPV